MKLGLQLGYWGAAPAAERRRDWCWPPRRPGSTRCSPPSRGARTRSPRWPGGARRPTRVRLGTAVVQLSAPHADRVARCTRSPSTTSPAAGRSSASACPGRRSSRAGTARRSASRSPAPASTSTIIRQVLAREAPVTSDGPHYPLPYPGPGADGLGKPLQPITHPLRADLPIWLGAEGPKNVALAAEIADGWLADLLLDSLADHVQRLARRGLRACAGARADAGGLRGRRQRAGGRHRRPGGRVRPAPPGDRALHRRHGRRAARTSTPTSSPGWATARSSRRSPGCSARAASSRRPPRCPTSSSPRPP